MRTLGTSDLHEVGQYRILAELGRGGMGRVLLGSGPDGRLVALKLVHEQFAEDDGFRGRFHREVVASRAVSGAYTAAVIDADPDAPTPWLASVFVPGPTLHDTITAVGALPEESVLRLAAGLASALIQIHRAGLVHRDLKPSNVLLTDDGPRVIDFGIVRAVSGEKAEDLTRAGWLVGSPAFMSPEQARGEQVTQASDVFSLGSVMVAACTGTSPFTGAATLQTLNNVAHHDPDLSGVPAAIRRIVEPCLVKDPAARPRPAELLESIGTIAPAARPWPAAIHQLIARRQAEVARLLDPARDSTEVISDEAPTVTASRVDTRPPVEPGPTRAETTLAERRTARRRLGIGTTVVALALAGVLVWALWPSPKTSPSPQVPAIPQLAQVGEMTGSVQVRWIKYSPDGNTLAAFYEDQTVQLWDVADRKQVGQILGPFGDGLRDMAFSRDNRTLITAKIDGKNSVTQQWDVASGHQIGESLIVDTGSTTLVNSPALSPDGRTLAIYYDGYESEQGMQLWDVAGRRQIGHFGGIEYDFGSVLFSPDGRTLFARANGTLTQWDVSSAQQVGNPISTPEDERFGSYTFSPDGAVLVTVGGDQVTNRVRLWDASSHNQIRQPMTIPNNGTYGVALSPDGKTLATISDDTVRLWNIDSGQEIVSALDNVNWMAFSPDGHTLATPGKDNSVRLWSVPSS